MRPERLAFIRRLNAMASACNEPLLINNGDSDHNERAKQLRSGLCVMLFSSLEDFVRERIAQVVDNIKSSAVPFSSLPQAFQNAATVEALSSLGFQAQFVSADRKLRFLMDELKKLGSLGEQNYSLSKYSFGHSKTNLLSSEFEAVLTGFNVEKPYETIFRTIQRLQLGAVNSAKTAFENLSGSRHSAAHDQSYEIPSADFLNNISSAFSIGLAFDVVLSCAALNLRNSYAATRGGLSVMRAADIGIFTISNKPVRGNFLLRQEGGRRAIFKGNNLSVVRAEGVRRLAGLVAVLVVQDSSGRPIEWYCKSSGD
ncbi:MAE_28990/MAE_18760 family HEPN-like nuclease [Xanthomonas sp. LF06-19]|uniref:MAE_28990/MAE_18760 family HEPN-like nuclease n=1 Tax=Xanthomonas sp. LF06-19 TaxID=3097551 RepID=UPI0025CE56B9|nr:MAE_28990/MAE_18760 family HEPN-like nuclease [Xanthomonas sp. LF06-19]MDY4281952.1 MAE_28990/MAE_18760 family HEPN-like nuclease [Xanthomonas sp. LF06-19]